MIKPFPKIFAIGSEYIRDIFIEEVEITEKIDGSQFGFGKIDGELYMRSKGQQLYYDNPNKMFREGIEYVYSIQDKIPDNMIFHCEYLQKPKHNLLPYTRIPKNHLCLFSVSTPGDGFVSDYPTLQKYAELFDIDVAPLVYKGKIKNGEEILSFMERESYLGGTPIEGVVAKNYDRKFLLGGQPMPLMAGKYVSEKFKETSRQIWGKEFTNKGRFDTYKESFKTEARWNKAIQHLKEREELENSPKDIGKLLKEINLDIIAEEKENIKEFLWEEYGKMILRYSTNGFAEWYKLQLLLNNNSNNDGERNAESAEDMPTA